MRRAMRDTSGILWEILCFSCVLMMAWILRRMW